MKKRLPQIVLIVSFLGFSWLAMQAVHELGHLIGAGATGGRVKEVVLHPCSISATYLTRNPHPLLVAWSGPLLGVLLPLLALAMARFGRLPGVYLFRFFAGTCLVANGVYVSVGAFAAMADAGDMLRAGSPRWPLVLFGLITFPAGLYLWNGLGPNFGLGAAQGKVSRKAAATSAVLLLLVVAAELVLGSM